MSVKKGRRRNRKLVELRRLVLSLKSTKIAVGIVFAAILLLIFVFWNNPNRLLVASVFMLAYGSVIQEGWEKGRRFRTVLFVVAIAMGGLFLTRAWNLIGEYEQKKAIMLEVARDWKLNGRVLEFPKFSATDDETLSQKFSYPQLYSGSLNPAISSGVFKGNNDIDAETLNIICAYSITLTKLQNMLDLVDETVFVGVGRNSLKQWRMVRNSNELHPFKKCHNRLGELLKRDGWLAQEGFLKVSDRTGDFQKLHEKVAVILNHDPNAPCETFVLSIDDWKTVREWYTKISDMRRPGGYFESEGLLRGEGGQKLASVYELFGKVLDLISASEEGSIVLNKAIYQAIVSWHEQVTTLMKHDRWVTKELDLLELNM